MLGVPVAKKTLVISDGYFTVIDVTALVFIGQAACLAYPLMNKLSC